jgi:hypothetical protein
VVTSVNVAIALTTSSGIGRRSRKCCRRLECCTQSERHIEATEKARSGTQTTSAFAEPIVQESARHRLY